MSKIEEKLRAATAKPAGVPALLVLEDGAVFAGTSCGAPGEAFGEVCFNTSLEGYLEIITDPSYAGQIVALTYPQVGNYGVNADDAQAERPALRALVVRDMCPAPSSWRSQESLGDYLGREGVVAIEGVDTRALVRHIRDAGAQRAVVSTTDADAASLLQKVRTSPTLVGDNQVVGVSCGSSYSYGVADLPASHDFALAAPADPRFKVVVYHCGVKRSILDGLVASGCELVVVPWDTPAEEVLALDPDGVFLSNGPGDPEAVEETYRAAEKLLGRVPLFGICLGHQMMAKAAGAKIEKLKFGHHGGNHPVQNLLTGCVEVTAQNHGFCPRFQSLGALVPELSGGATEHVDDLREWGRRGIAPVVANEHFGRIRLTHVNLNDGTAEGFAFQDVPAFSVQYHPEAAPGPTDAHYLFTAFARLMEGRTDYLGIDIAADRLSGWKFGSTAEEEVA
ncbi:glutamine-hydrolyzing carbamoyl-phosphate synthase small subunit [Adlercreutzia sp. R21]|uniref:glutamine-hydrolyzing carbamoyl-phosphate synthase small subunit n=1 Tax=Adlercreutzia wanghongyangiae TaxID=3111451 RepID=UPI002DB7E8DB|nr:glutamine-hydrolyzing carbamoyl-phosphate synthase small subunit [Adlercreutzia sp. R21]MEC4184058.1 glutamine-hydrolyzing carbamoyl-phosphate synthase small subunit [Adlercreutzia sp. R21]